MHLLVKEKTQADFCLCNGLQKKFSWHLVLSTLVAFMYLLCFCLFLLSTDYVMMNCHCYTLWHIMIHNHMEKWACPRSAGARLSTRETGNEASVESSVQLWWRRGGRGEQYASCLVAVEFPQVLASTIKSYWYTGPACANCTLHEPTLAFPWTINTTATTTKREM